MDTKIAQGPQQTGPAATRRLHIQERVGALLAQSRIAVALYQADLQRSRTKRR